MDVQIEMEFAKKFTAGFFGGEGFVLQALLGKGDVFVKAGGTLVRRELEQGETLRISSGCLVAFTQNVEYDVQTMPGFKNVVFGGEGLFVTTLTGPGTVWLQGMPPDRMINEIARRVPSGGIGLGIPIGMGGSGEATDVDGQGEDSGEGEGEGEEDGPSEDVAAMSDSSIEADRNATVASSGGFDDTIESDSPEALFGDVASNATDATPDAKDETEFFGDDGDFSSSVPDLEDSTTFSSDSTQFDDDDTSFSTEEQFDSSFENESELDNVSDEGSSITDVLGSIWDFFNDDE